MAISYTLPLSKGFNRMKSALFHPFDISKWFRVGFAAWLATLTNCQGGGGGSQFSNSTNWDDFFSFPETAWQWLMNNPLWSNLILFGLIFLFLLISFFIWLSARGKFMFVNNAAKNSDEISKPWHEYSREGNSLFIFELLFGWFVFAAVMAFLIHGFKTAKILYYEHATDIAIFWSIAGLVLILIGIAISLGFINLLLKDFVVPIMYKHRIGVLRAWGRFLPLFGKRFFGFVAYGLFYLVLSIGVGMLVILFALITCCVGLLLIALPYIGAVILLPVSYTFRAFSLEFLAQFGDEYNVFSKEVVQ